MALLNSASQRRVSLGSGRPGAQGRPEVAMRAVTAQQAAPTQQLPAGVKSIPEDVKPLFEPIKVGRMQLTNRMVYAPLTRCRAIDNVPVPAMATYYGQRAFPGSLMIAEATIITKAGQGYPHTPGLWSQQQVEAWKPVVKAVKDRGAFFFNQIWHVGRGSHAAYQPDGINPVSSSAVRIDSEQYRMVWTGSEMAPYPTPTPLDKAGIDKVVAEYATAAKNALAAGFDGVEIHGANGYLIDQFTKSSVNQRTDEYGGSIENRCRFALEVVRAVVDAVGAERVGIRLSPFADFLDATDATPYATFTYLVEQLNKFGLAYVHMVEGRVAGNGDKPSEDVLDPFRKVFKGPFIAAGGYHRDNGAAAVGSGHADLIAYGREWLANPDLPKRFLVNAPVRKGDRDTYYTQDPVKGYTDYPTLEEEKEHSSQQ